MKNQIEKFYNFFLAPSFKLSLISSNLLCKLYREMKQKIKIAPHPSIQSSRSLRMGGLVLMLIITPVLIGVRNPFEPVHTESQTPNRPKLVAISKPIGGPKIASIKFNDQTYHLTVNKLFGQFIVLSIGNINATLKDTNTKNEDDLFTIEL